MVEIQVDDRDECSEYAKEQYHNQARERKGNQCKKDRGDVGK